MAKKEGGKKVNFFEHAKEEVSRVSDVINYPKQVILDRQDKKKKEFADSSATERANYDSCVKAAGGSVEAKTRCAKKHGSGKK